MNPSTTALTLNLQLPNIATVSWAVQGDQLSRVITATLVDGSSAWNPQAGYHGVVRFHKPDGTNGVYDVDEDGNTAVTWSGNVATVKIVQQALTVPGTVIMQLEFYDTNNARVSAFGWCNNVQPSAVTDTEFISTDYYNILSLQIAAVLEAAEEMTPSDTTPLMDGTGEAGSSLNYSRGDHVHPSDTAKVSKAGDTMTGSLTVNSLITVKRDGGNAIAIDDGVAVSGTAPASDTNCLPIVFRDKNGAVMGTVRARQGTDGKNGIYIYGSNSGNTNYLFLSVDSSGNKSILLNAAAAWLSALGLSVTSTSTVSDIISAESGITVSAADFAQQGNVAQLRIVFQKSTSVASGNTTIGTLKSGKRPTFNALATAHTNHDLACYVNSSGNVVVNGPITAETSYTIYSTFILA